CPHRLSAQAEAQILELRRQTTRPGQTARPKHSSASSNANGHTASSTHQASIEHEHSQAGYAGTTTTDHTAASTATHPKAASHTLRGPTPSGRAAEREEERAEEGSGGEDDRQSCCRRQHSRFAMRFGSSAHNASI